MSLLMEALRKAEETKRQNSERSGVPSAPPELTLQPLSQQPLGQPDSSPLRSLSLQIDSVDADSASIPGTSANKPRRTGSNERARELSTPVGSGADLANQAAARNAFAAKRTTPASAGRWLLFIALMIALSGIAAYFWWQLTRLSVSPQPSPLAAKALPVESVAASAASPRPAVSPINAEPEAAHEVLRAITPGFGMTEQSSGTAQPARPVDKPQQRSSPHETNDPPPAETTMLHVQKGLSPRSTELEQAFDALQTNRLEAARLGYEKVLRDDPRNPDALLGLATLATLRGNADEALFYYRQALESDPGDPTAQAGIASLSGSNDPAQSESRLKTALAAQPQSSALHFALGNVFARQSRWSEAQQAYFAAWSLEPDNPDFIHNLAVSLDHLHQTRLAIQYYRMSLAATESSTAVRPIAFDPAAVRNRLLELQP